MGLPMGLHPVGQGQNTSPWKTSRRLVNQMLDPLQWASLILENSSFLYYEPLKIKYEKSITNVACCGCPQFFFSVSWDWPYIFPKTESQLKLNINKHLLPSRAIFFASAQWAFTLGWLGHTSLLPSKVCQKSVKDHVNFSEEKTSKLISPLIKKVLII